MNFPKFPTYVCVGDSVNVTIDDVTYTARIVFDDQHKIDDDDTHNTDQRVTGCNVVQQKKLLAARAAWFNNEWFYCGVELYRECDACGSPELINSLWGIECNYPGSDNSYLSEVANDLFSEVGQ